MIPIPVLLFTFCAAASPAQCETHRLYPPSVEICNATAHVVLPAQLPEGRELVWWRCAMESGA